MGSNPTLSASSFLENDPGERYGEQEKKWHSCCGRLSQPFDINIQLHRTKQDASREWFAIRLSPKQQQVAKLHYGAVPVSDWTMADLQAKEDGSGAVPLAELQKKGLTPDVTVGCNLMMTPLPKACFTHFPVIICGGTVEFSQPPGEGHTFFG